VVPSTGRVAGKKVTKKGRKRGRVGLGEIKAKRGLSGKKDAKKWDISISHALEPSETSVTGGGEKAGGLVKKGGGGRGVQGESARRGFGGRSGR